MKKKIFAISGCLILCLLPFFLVWLGCTIVAAVDDDYKVTNKHSAVEADLNKLWGMKLPEGFTPSYVFYNRYCAFGEGFFYAVYECEDYNENFLNDFSDEYNQGTENAIINDCYERFYDKLETYKAPYKVLLDREYLPDFSSDFISISYHKDNNNNVITGEGNTDNYRYNLYFAYFFDTKMLYIYEWIS